MDSNVAVDAAAWARLCQRLEERAGETDRCRLLPREHLCWLAETGYYRLALPRELGGVEADAKTQWQAVEQLSGACGVTHFVQAQHVGAIQFLRSCSNSQMVQARIPDWVAGVAFCGVAFAHLRRPNSPVSVFDGGDHWVFQGEAPWFSGWGLMDEVVLGGRLPDGDNLYVLSPTRGMTARPSPALAAMNASGTVALIFQDWRVAKAHTLLRQTPAEMQVKDVRTLLRYSAPPLGLVSRAARHLLAVADPGAGGECARALLSHSHKLRERALALDESLEPQTAVRVRTEANELALRAAQAVVISAGGSGNETTSLGNRLLREASFYYLTQLTAPLRDAALLKLGGLA